MSTEQQAKHAKGAPTEPSAGGGAAPAPPLPRRSPAATALGLIERYTLVVLLVVVMIFFSTWQETSTAYATADNMRNIAVSQVVLAVLALGTIIPLICGHFDLSVGAVAGMTSVFTAVSYSEWGLPLWAGVAFGVLLGAAIGAINGLVITRFGVNALITTLGSASVVTGVVSWYTEGLPVMQGIPEGLLLFGRELWAGVPRMVYLLVAFAVLIWYVLQHTPFGRYLHSVGVNPGSAQLVGLRIQMLVVQSFILSGASAGLAGVLLLAQTGAGNPGVGNNLTLTALAAAFLGATAVLPGRFNVVGTLVAVYFLAAAITGLTYAQVKDFIHELFTGGALVLAVAISALLARRRARRG